MEETGDYVYKPYPRRLYERGDVTAESVVVENANAEDLARARGFRKAWEPANQDTIEIPKFGDSENVVESTDRDWYAANPKAKPKAKKASE